MSQFSPVQIWINNFFSGPSKIWLVWVWKILSTFQFTKIRRIQLRTTSIRSISLLFAPMVSGFPMVLDTIMDFTIQKSDSFRPFENRIFRSNSTESNLSIELCRTLVNVNPDVSGNNQMSSGRFQILICTQRPTFEKLFTGAKVGRRRKAQLYRSML